MQFDALMGSTKDPVDGHAVAKTCYSAAMIYAVLIAFCGCQVRVLVNPIWLGVLNDIRRMRDFQLTLNQRVPRGEIQL